MNRVQRIHGPMAPRAVAGISMSMLIATSLLIPLPAVGQNSLKSVSLMPLWSPQAQFAGYYVALDKGIYARHGIDLKILKAGPGQSPVAAVRDGTADFAVLWLTTALQHRANGLPLVNLAQIIQRSSLLLVSKRSSGIRKIADLEGSKVGLWDGDLSIPARALFARHNVKVREVPQSFTVNLFLRGGIDVTSAMWYNEYHTILMSGVDADELNVISLAEQGMNFPEDGLYALEGSIRDDPGLARAVVAASLEGWRYAFDHPDEALDVVVKYMREARLPANRVHQKWMLERMRDLIMPDQPGRAFGRLHAQDFDVTVGTMGQEGLLRSHPAYSEFTWGADAGEE